MDAPIRFKFKFIDDAGNEAGFLAKKGSFDGETLTLGKDELPVAVVLRAQRRFNRLVLEILQGEGGETGALAFAITKGRIDDLLSALNRSSSATWATIRSEALRKEGRGGAYRSAPCPYCASVVDLTDREPTPQLHCEYCDSVATLAEPRPAGEADMRPCDECGFYAKPRLFTTFYFYFLLVVYGYRSQKRYMCHSCMRGEAWKMVGVNMFFILGLPFSLVQLVRAYRGGVIGSKDFAGLDDANAAAKAGKVERAAQGYEGILQRVDHAAGVRFNLGLANANAARWQEAATHFELALRSCGNYAPAFRALHACYGELGLPQMQAQLLQCWKLEDGPQVEGAEQPVEASA